VINIKKKN